MCKLNSIVNNFRVKRYGQVTKNWDLSKNSYWKIGGIASYLFEVDSLTSIQWLIKELTNNNLNFLFVGNTTNLLFDDTLDDLILIKFSNLFTNVTFGKYISVDAGISCPKLSMKLSKLGFEGLEHIIGIPGKLGGLVYMNGGSNRKSISENIISVTCISPDGNIVDLSKDECLFSYRSSIFQEKKLIILQVKLNLPHNNDCLAWINCKNILKSRRDKFPLDYPNCGSVFISNKNNYDKVGPPGKIIESVGLKGMIYGNAQISNLHANFIINKGGATSSDIIKLVTIVVNKVKDEYDLVMDSEVLFVQNYKVIPLTNYIKTGIK